MKSSFCIDLQRFMLIPTIFPLTPNQHLDYTAENSIFSIPHKNNNGATLNELRRIAMFNLKNFLY